MRSSASARPRRNPAGARRDPRRSGNGQTGAVIIEHHTFRLAEGVDDEAFLGADRRVQTEFSPFRAGFVRRTTARAADGQWLVETLWGTPDDAEAAARSDDPVMRAFLDCIDAGSASVRHYTTLD